MANNQNSSKRIISTAIVIIAIVAGIMYLLNKNKKNNEAATAEVAKVNEFVSVRVDTARFLRLDAANTANGTFIPKQEVTVSAEAGGRVLRVLVSEGSFVKAGQTLAIVEGEKINVNVANAQANFNNAKSDLARFESAYQSGGVTKQQLDQVKLQYETAKNNLKSAQITAGDVAIKTSVSGIVNKKKIEPGTYVNVGTPAFDIVNISSLKLRVNVDEKNVAVLKVGQQVPVTASIYADETFNGKITFIAPKSDGSLNFPVEIEVSNTNNKLKAGMYGTATFGKNEAVTTLVVPRNAFVGSVSDNTIFILKDGKAVETKVEAGRTFGDKVEVLNGLSEGQEVITSGQINLFDQTPVKAIK